MLDPAYLSIVDFPSDLSEDERITTLLAAADASRRVPVQSRWALDTYLATQLVRRGFPQIIARLPHPAACAAADALHDLGVTTFVATKAELDALPHATPIKHMLPGKGKSFLAEPWRGTPFVLDFATLTHFIYAQVRSVSVAAASPIVGGSPFSLATSIAIGGHVPNPDFDDTPEQSCAAPTTSHRLRNVIDLIFPAQRVRIVSNRFNSDALEPFLAPLNTQGAAFNSVPNLARVKMLAGALTKLTGLAPDTTFKEFRCSPELVAAASSAIGPPAGLTPVRPNENSTLLELYSRWSVLLLRSFKAG